MARRFVTTLSNENFEEGDDMYSTCESLIVSVTEMVECRSEGGRVRELNALHELLPRFSVFQSPILIAAPLPEWPLGKCTFLKSGASEVLQQYESALLLLLKSMPENELSIIEILKGLTTTDSPEENIGTGILCTPSSGSPGPELL